MTRDFEFWRDPDCDALEATRLEELQQEKRAIAEKLGKKPRSICIALRVTVWDCTVASGRGSGHFVYWAGLTVSVIQLLIAAVPWFAYDDEWFTFGITFCGTLLAYASGALPQWIEEKSGVRTPDFDDPANDRKAVFLIEGNGSHNAILIISQHDSLDPEALAEPQRPLYTP